MPKEKPFKVPFKSFYKSQAEDIAMFGYIYGIQRKLPNISTTALIECFRKDFDLTEEDLPMESAMVTFQNMKNKFFDLGKSDL